MARAINGRLLLALSALASKQASPTKETMQKCKLFLDCMATEEEMILTYHESGMVLAVVSDASYLSETKSRSRVGGHFYLAGHEENPTTTINLSSVRLRVSPVCPSHAPKHKTPYTFIYFQLSVMFGESFCLVVACCCSCFVVAGSVPLRVKKMRRCFASELAKKIFTPPPTLGYTRLPRC